MKVTDMFGQELVARDYGPPAGAGHQDDGVLFTTSRMLRAARRLLAGGRLERDTAALAGVRSPRQHLGVRGGRPRRARRCSVRADEISRAPQSTVGSVDGPLGPYGEENSHHVRCVQLRTTAPSAPR
jgi:hypothetical protein